MSRNVTILVIILVILVVAGYLVWLRSQLQGSQGAAVLTPTPTIQEVTPTMEPLASPSATTKPEATPSATPRKTGSQGTATKSGTAR